MDKDISENNKFILQGRIYPILTACVNNRYKIVLGFFAFYSFILNSDNNYISKNFDQIKVFGSIMFVLLTSFNSVNYFANSGEKSRMEGLRDSWLSRNNMELFFCIGMSAIVIISCFYLPIGKS